MSTTAVRNCFFAWAVCTAGLIYASSPIAVWVAKLSSCGPASIPCWELVAIVATAGRGFAHVVLGVGLFIVLRRRIRQLGLSSIWTAGVALWLIGATPFLVWTNNPFSVQFGPGVVYAPPIVLLAMAMILSLFLCFARSGVLDPSRFGAERACQVAKFAGIHLTLVLLANIVTALTFVPFVRELASFVAFIIIGPHKLLRSVLTLGLPLGFVIWLDVVIFAVALSYLLFMQGPEQPETEADAMPLAGAAPAAVMTRAVARPASRTGFGRRGV